ncbi:MAG: hypothetical protein LPJ89_02420 [Hymenobacteraceae bacterium]|nr:hypothetical protein [Hymenobacteraceae bacterium]MDX5442620.1 hypothetical protein [Hymenobacteraceae bacterium]MDX5511152.1 hypothetical protein [Hymenobacteraceae bacterium]
MTKGHNQNIHKQTNPKAKSKDDIGENRHLTDSKKNKSPDQGRSNNPNQAGGKKGQNAI